MKAQLLWAAQGILIELFIYLSFLIPGPSSFEPQPEQRPYVSLIAKRQALNNNVSKILTSGAEHMKSLQSENRTAGDCNRNQANFHFELLRLRQNWRLKKVSNTILGDLSFKTAGSQYKQSGIFEVIKSDEKSETETTAQTPTSSARYFHYFFVL